MLDSDEDGFEEAVFEIRSFDRQQASSQGKPIARVLEPPVVVGEFSVTTTTLWDRYSTRTALFRRYEEIPLDPSFTALFKPPSFFTPKRLYAKKKTQFNSCFESGNLMAAYKVKGVYELLMHNDANTNGYTQWFNFRVRNAKPAMTIRIVNFLKPHSHFKHGMQPIVSAHQDSDSEPLGVEVINITYSKNNMVRMVVTIKMQHQQSKNGTPIERSLYTLQFELRGQATSYYVSMNYAYPLSRLQSLLRDLKPTLLTKTLLGNPCYYLTIPNDLSGRKRKVVVIARQHPGETVSSYVMEGLIRFLNGTSAEATFLKRQAEFLLVPMVNVDGVQMGNFRCNATGTDLNRIWHKPIAASHPEIHKLKALLLKHPDLDFFIDLHGHSKKMNTFLYGCRDETDPVACRVFPSIMSQVSPHFSFNDCTFSISKYKVKTARAIIFNQLKGDRLRNVFTVETSFFGYTKQGQCVQHTIADLHAIGQDLLRSLAIYWGGGTTYDHIDVEQITRDLQSKAEHYQAIDQMNMGSDDESDSEVEIDLLEEADERVPRIVDTIKQQAQRYSKSVSQPPPSRQRDSIKPRAEAPHRIPTIVSTVHQEMNPPKKDLRTYQKKNHKAFEEISRVQVYHHTQDQHLPTMIPNDPKESRDQIGVTEIPELLQLQQQHQLQQQQQQMHPSFQITRQYFRRQLEAIPDNSTEAVNHSALRVTKTPLQLNFMRASNEPQGPSLPRTTQQNQSQQHYHFVMKRDTKTRPSEIPNPELQTEDTMSQVLRNIWLMNQVKYGPQLQQPKPVKYFKAQEDDDVRLFDDKRLNVTSRRFVFKKQQFNIQEFDKLF